MIENTVLNSAFEQTIRVLDRQGEVLGELRQRASIVLSGTGITVSLMGSGALKGSYSHALALTALLATFAGITACIAVLWPGARSCNYSTISVRSKLFTAAAVLLLVQIMVWAALILQKTW